MITDVSASLALPGLSRATPGRTQADVAAGFGAALEAAAEQLAASQAKARDSAAAWERGITQDLSAVMIDQQVASLGFQLALNVRNRALGAYRDIMNMPV